MTPALIVLGFPANIAVGTSLAWVVANGVVGVFRHRKLGNVDMKLGLVMVVAAIGGMEIGVRMLDWAERAGLADESVLAVAMCALLVVGAYTLVESVRSKRRLDRRRDPRVEPPPAGNVLLSERLQSINVPPMLRFSGARVTISLWVLLGIGLVVGVLAGFIGVGGGFIMVPSLVYLVGVPSFVAVGTDLFQIVFSASYGVIRHSMSGNVIIFASFVMIIASFVGVQLGAMTTRYVRGVSVRYVLGICILLAAIGAALKLSGVLAGEAATWAELGAVIVTFGSLGLAVVMILALLVAGLRYRTGRRIPVWVESLLLETAE